MLGGGAGGASEHVSVGVVAPDALAPVRVGPTAGALEAPIAGRAKQSLVKAKAIAAVDRRDPRQNKTQVRLQDPGGRPRRPRADDAGAE